MEDLPCEVIPAFRGKSGHGADLLLYQELQAATALLMTTSLSPSRPQAEVSLCADALCPSGGSSVLIDCLLLGRL